MEREELDRMAWRGEIVPPGLSSADTLYFTLIRALYDRHRMHQPDAARGKAEKQRVAEAARRYQLAEDAAQRYAKLMSDTGAARAAYRKSRAEMGKATALYLPPEAVAVIAAADRLVETMDGMKIEV